MKGKLLFSSILVAVALCACNRDSKLYDGPEYMMFSDSLSVNMVLSDNGYFNVPVVASKPVNYDRTVAVEIIDKGSNAIEGYHYNLRSNTITIPAGQTAANVEVQGVYEHFEPSDSLGFTLKLVVPESMKWDSSLYPDYTKVVMYKSCPFAIEDFTGWCMLTSLFLESYPGTENRYMQRLIRTEKHPEEENTIILRDFLFKGYDVTMSFDPSDPAKPTVSMEEGQVISDEIPVFGIVNGDNKILAKSSPYSLSSFNSCQKFVSLWLYVYVEDLGKPVGTVGEYFNVLEWVSDEEADRIKRESGL